MFVRVKLRRVYENGIVKIIRGIDVCTVLNKRFNNGKRALGGSKHQQGRTVGERVVDVQSVVKCRLHFGVSLLWQQRCVILCGICESAKNNDDKRKSERQVSQERGAEGCFNR